MYTQLNAQLDEPFDVTETGTPVSLREVIDTQPESVDEAGMPAVLAGLDALDREGRHEDLGESAEGELPQYEVDPTSPSRESGPSRIFRRRGQWWIALDMGETVLEGPLRTRHEHIARLKKDTIDTRLNARPDRHEPAGTLDLVHWLRDLHADA
jgi:hypothetical protein